MDLDGPKEKGYAIQENFCFGFKNWFYKRLLLNSS
jgi:hypothetical protein